MADVLFHIMLVYYVQPSNTVPEIAIFHWNC